MKLLIRQFNFISSLPPFKRRIFLIILDCLILFFTSFLILYFTKVTLGKVFVLNTFYYFVTPVFIGLPIYYFSNVYKSLSKYVSSQFIYFLLSKNLLVVFIISIIFYLFDITTFSLSIWLIYWIVHSSTVSLSRLILKDLLLIAKFNKELNKKNVAIFGAGDTGGQIAASLKFSSLHKLIYFIDDSNEFSNRLLDGIPIIKSSELNKLKGKIDLIYLALEEHERSKLLNITHKAQKLGIRVCKAPVLTGDNIEKQNESFTNPIRIEDLLGRSIVKPFKDLLKPAIENYVICVTGAGGSIGSELCKQIIKLNPKKLILFESSEQNLYNIHNELKHHISSIVLIMGDACDENLVKKVFQKYKVEILFHTAAYKHVPLVEENPLQGLKNNIFSTKVLCEKALEANLKRVMIISTDKAVRPTNIMGASKRLSELIVQSFAEYATLIEKETNQEKPKFSMVRFGNVLGSSGSVVPLFKKQIESGGPVTLTDSKIIRYFMTIAEAAQLVIQSSVLAKGGDIFLLDMGEPVKILDLARLMIGLSGLKVRDKKNQNGDIEIKIIGLRPGEKLYEELLIDKKSESTKHPLIYKAKEKSLPYKFLWEKIELLKKYINDQDEYNALRLTKILVPEWIRGK